jgi:hypothetical protein
MKILSLILKVKVKEKSETHSCVFDEVSLQLDMPMNLLLGPNLQRKKNEHLKSNERQEYNLEYNQSPCTAPETKSQLNVTIYSRRFMSLVLRF